MLFVAGTRYVLAAWLAICVGVADAATDAALRTPATRPVVGEVILEGRSAVAARVLAPVLRARRGRPLTLDTIRAIANDIEAIYRQRGFLFAQVIVPPQEIANGVVRLVVLEGRIGRVSIEGNSHYSDRFIRYFLSPATNPPALSEPRLEQALLTLERFPDLRPQAVFVPGRSQGTTDLILKVKDGRPLHLALDYNNFGSRLVGRHGASAFISAGSILREGDLLSYRVVVPFPSASDPFITAGYGQVISNDGTRLDFSYSNAATTVGQELRSLDIRGSSSTFGLTASRPLKLSQERASQLSLGLVSKSVENSIFTNVPVNRDELRLVVAGYDDTISRASDNTRVSTLLTQGLGSTLGASPRFRPQPSRVGAGNQFTKLLADVRHLRRLKEGQALSLRGTVQIADTQLPVTEQFGVGGLESVRGFLQSEFLADRGYTGSIEYHRSLVQRQRESLTMVLFLDHGEGLLTLPQPGERRTRQLTGTGVGLRGGFGRATSVRLDFGFPVNVATDTEGRDVVVYAQAATQF